jgi:hypothetical protein
MFVSFAMAEEVGWRGGLGTGSSFTFHDLTVSGTCESSKWR